MSNWNSGGHTSSKQYKIEKKSVRLEGYACKQANSRYKSIKIKINIIHKVCGPLTAAVWIVNVVKDSSPSAVMLSCST